MPETIFDYGLFRGIILPFLLVFTVVFAVLERVKLFGEEKRQINALIALFIAVITVTFTYQSSVIINLVPFLAVAVVIILIFMLLYGFVIPVDKEKGLTLPKGLQIAFGGLIGIALIIAVLWATDFLDTVVLFIFRSENSRAILTNVILIAAIVGAFILVLKSKK